MPLPTRTKRRTQELPKWKKVSSFERALQREELISQKNCQILRENSPYQEWKNLFSEDILEQIVLQTTFIAIKIKTTHIL